MEIFIFARFHAREGSEMAVEQAIGKVVVASRDEPGCLSIQGFRSTRDPRLFLVHSRWTSEESFEIHAALPHTVEFLKAVEPSIDHPLDVTRSIPLE